MKRNRLGYLVNGIDTFLEVVRVLGLWLATTVDTASRA